MGQRGAPKKPSEVEKLHGNPSKRPIKEEIKIEKPKEIPKPPMFLDTTAKKEWKRLAPKIYEVGILTDADIASFAAYCDSYSTWVAATKAMQALKPTKSSPAVFTFETDKGYQQQIPEIGIANKAKEQMLKFAREFGLTPSSRIENIDAPKSENQEMSIMDFRKKRSRAV